MSNIDKYEIEDRQALTELVKKAASLYGKEVLNHLANFGITTDSEVEEIKKAINKPSVGWFFLKLLLLNKYFLSPGFNQ